MSYTKRFEDALNAVPRTQNGRDLAESTRRNMAIQDLQQRDFGDVYPKEPVPDDSTVPARFRVKR